MNGEKTGFIRRIVKGFVRNLIFLLFPVRKNRMIFAFSPSGMDNSESLLDYIRANCDNVSIGVRTENRQDQSLFKEKYRGDRRINVFIKKNRPLFAYWFLLTSQYVFFSNGSILHVANKRQGQIVINLWHGCGYKDIQNPANKWINGTMFDYVLVPGKVFVETKAAFFSCEKGQVLPIGYPRYDILRKQYPQVERELNKHLFKKMVVWMPTYRKVDSGEAPESNIQTDFDLPLLNSEEELKQLNRFCQQRQILLYIKKHPAQVPYTSEGLNLSNIVFLSYNDLRRRGIQNCELLASADALISDYSSAAIDYLLLDRPVAFALADFEAYRDTRGFVFADPLKYMPGYHLYTFADMKMFLDDVVQGLDPYAEKRCQIMPEVHNSCDNYCARVWETIQTLGG